MKKEIVLQIGRSFGIQRQDIQKIILKETGLTKQQFFLSDDIKIPQSMQKRLENYFRKVSFGYPIEYILRNAEFYGLDFYVDKRCLIPRNDTEIMVKQAIDSIVDNCVYVDIGTGSAAIPISVLMNCQGKIKKSLALDISPEALEVSNINIQRYGLDNIIECIESDLLTGIIEKYFGVFAKDSSYVLTANLPYIKDKDYGNIDNEVILYEPSVALYGGKETGFELYKKLIYQLFAVMKDFSVENIVLLIEIGFDQKGVAVDFLNKHGLEHVIYKDNAGVERCIKIKF